MSDMKREITMVLDETSHELARRLNNDLSDLMERQPDWAKPLIDGLFADLHNDSSPAWLAQVTSPLSTIKDSVTAIYDHASQSSENVRKTATRADLQAVRDIVLSLRAALTKHALAASTRFNLLSNVLAPLAEIDSRLAAVQTETQSTRSLIGEIPTRDEVMRLEQELHRIEGVLVADVTAMATSLHNVAQVVSASAIQLSSISSADEVQKRLLSGVDNIVREIATEHKAASASLVTILKSQNEIGKALRTVSEAVSTFNEELKQQRQLLNKLARPWYRRLFGA